MPVATFEAIPLCKPLIELGEGWGANEQLELSAGRTSPSLQAARMLMRPCSRPGTNARLATGLTHSW